MFYLKTLMLDFANPIFEMSVANMIIIEKLSKQWDGENAYAADGYPYLLVDDEKGNSGPLH